MTTSPPGTPDPFDGVAHQPATGPYGTVPGGYGTSEPQPQERQQVHDAAPGSDQAAYPSVRPGDPGYVTGAAPSNRRVVGWIGVVVLYLLALWQLVIPSVATLLQSMSSGNPIRGSGTPVGLQNWSDVMPQLAPALGFSILAVLPVTIIAAVLGLVIGAGMAPEQPLARLTRILVGVLGALFVPLGIGLSRFMAAGAISSPADARSFVIVSVTLAALPLLTAAFATAFAAVLAGDAPGRGVATVSLLGIAGALALGPQLLDVPLAFTGSGPAGATDTPMLLAYRQGFQMLDFGRGSAVSGAVLLLAGLLGIVAVLALVLGRMRLGVHDHDERSNGAGRRGGGAAGIVPGVAAIVALLAALALHLPVLTGGFGAAPDAATPPGSPALATWVPSALGVLLQVGIALLGGAAIGWCRPAGKHSMWLLLPLAPWLFVGPGPLMLHTFGQFQQLGLVNTWLALVPSPLVVVGAVVVMTLVFAGLRERPHPGRRAVGAAAIGAAGVLLLTQSQSLLPALGLSTDTLNATAPMTFLRMLRMVGSQGGDSGWLLAMLYPLPAFLLVAALGVLAQLGMRRVVALRE